MINKLNSQAKRKLVDPLRRRDELMRAVLAPVAVTARPKTIAPAG
jgi:hypothetical protein